MSPLGDDKSQRMMSTQGMMSPSEDYEFPKDDESPENVQRQYIVHQRMVWLQKIQLCLQVLPLMTHVLPQMIVSLSVIWELMHL